MKKLMYVVALIVLPVAWLFVPWLLLGQGLSMAVKEFCRWYTSALRGEWRDFRWAMGDAWRRLRT